jgi:hypothetical protein
MLEPGGPPHKPLQTTGGGLHPGERDFAGYAGSLAKRQPNGRALLVAIDGYGGSGKSTFAALLHGALRGAGITIVTTVEADGFVMNLREEDWRPIPSMPGMRAPYRIDLDRLRRELLEPLRRRFGIGYPEALAHLRKAPSEDC